MVDRNRYSDGDGDLLSVSSGVLCVTADDRCIVCMSGCSHMEHDSHGGTVLNLAGITCSCK